MSALDDLLGLDTELSTSKRSALAELDLAVGDLGSSQEINKLKARQTLNEILKPIPGQSLDEARAQFAKTTEPAKKGWAEWASELSIPRWSQSVPLGRAGEAVGVPSLEFDDRLQIGRPLTAAATGFSQAALPMAAGTGTAALVMAPFTGGWSLLGIPLGAAAGAAGGMLAQDVQQAATEAASPGSTETIQQAMQADPAAAHVGSWAANAFGFMPSLQASVLQRLGGAAAGAGSQAVADIASGQSPTLESVALGAALGATTKPTWREKSRMTRDELLAKMKGGADGAPPVDLGPAAADIDAQLQVLQQAMTPELRSKLGEADPAAATNITPTEQPLPEVNLEFPWSGGQVKAPQVNPKRPPRPEPAWKQGGAPGETIPVTETPQPDGLRPYERRNLARQNEVTVTHPKTGNKVTFKRTDTFESDYNGRKVRSEYWEGDGADFVLNDFGDHYEIGGIEAKGMGAAVGEFVSQRSKEAGKPYYSDSYLSPDARRMWEGLVTKGEARPITDGPYSGQFEWLGRPEAGPVSRKATEAAKPQAKPDAGAHRPQAAMTRAQQAIRELFSTDPSDPSFPERQARAAEALGVAQMGRHEGFDNPYAQGGRATKIQKLMDWVKKNNLQEQAKGWGETEWDAASARAGVTGLSKKTIAALREAAGGNGTPGWSAKDQEAFSTLRQRRAALQESASGGSKSATDNLAEFDKRNGEALRDLQARADAARSGRAPSEMTDAELLRGAAEPGVITPKKSGLGALGAGDYKFDESAYAQEMRRELARRGVNAAKDAVPALVRLGMNESQAHDVARQLYPSVEDVIHRGVKPSYEPDLTTPEGRLAASYAHAAAVAKLPGEGKRVRPPAEMQDQLAKDQTVAIDKINRASHMTTAEKQEAQKALLELTATGRPARLSNRQLEVLEMAFGAKFATALAAERSAIGRIAGNLIEIPKLNKAMLTMVDMSMPLRQNLFFTVSRPRQSIPAFLSMHKYFFSPESYKNFVDSIPERANAKLYEQVGIFQGENTGTMRRREDFAMSRMAERIPVIRNVYRASSRAANGFNLRMRLDVFDAIDKAWRDNGLTPERNPVKYKTLGEYINVMTGRGSLGRFEKYASELNGLMFSPHLTASRFQMWKFLLWHNVPAEVRKLAMRDIGVTAAAAMSMLGLAKYSGIPGVSVEGDLRSPNAWKIRIGNTRIDILGGQQQIARYAAQLLTGQRKDEGGMIREANRLETALRSAQSKASPAAGLGIDILYGKDFRGRTVALDTRQFLDRTAPMILMDLVDAVNEHGLAGSTLAIPAWYGAGVQTYANPATQFEYRLRSGEPPQTVMPEMQQAVAEGKLTDSQATDIMHRVTVDQLTADFWQLNIDEARLNYANADTKQKAILKPLLDLKELNHEIDAIEKRKWAGPLPRRDKARLQELHEEKRRMADAYDRAQSGRSQAQQEARSKFLGLSR